MRANHHKVHGEVTCKIGHGNISLHTPYARGEQTAQNPNGGCGKVTTERTRTFVDGHTDKQNFHASYRCI